MRNKLSSGTSQRKFRIQKKLKIKMQSIVSKATLAQTPSMLLTAGGLGLLVNGRVYEGVFCVVAGTILQELKYRRWSKTV